MYYRIVFLWVITIVGTISNMLTERKTEVFCDFKYSTHKLYVSVLNCSMFVHVPTVVYHLQEHWQQFQLELGPWFPALKWLIKAPIDAFASSFFRLYICNLDQNYQN